jgi:DNA polymerase III sliding clamp (beta) subunit (PCNA family)
MNAITIPTAHFQAIASFRALGDIKFYLNGVLIETGQQGAFIVATDACAVAAARIDKKHMSETRVVIPLHIVEQLEKLKIQKNPAFSIEMPEKIGNYEGNKRKITLKTVDYEVQFDEIDGTFPQWRRVAQHTFDGKAVAYDPRYLTKINDAARLIKGHKKGDLITLVRPGANDTCGFAWLDNGGEACAWVAPIRGEVDQLPGEPAWTV